MTDSVLRRQAKLFPDLSFWFHLSFEDLCKMPNWARQDYVDALPRLLEQYRDILIVAAIVPWMDPKDREQMLRSEQSQPVEPLSKDKYLSLLGESGIEVVREPPR